jgi:alpha-N-arabinofuranosidase
LLAVIVEPVAQRPAFRTADIEARHAAIELRKPGWPKAPPLIEEIYNFEDALIVGGVLITLMNNADRVKAACLAQLVNVIGPIMTETGGPAWRQTIFHPFVQASAFGHGDVLRLKTECGTFAGGDYAHAPLLLASAVHDAKTGAAAIFALNRSTDQEMSLEAELRGLGLKKVTAATTLHAANLKQVKTKSDEAVAPKPNASAALKGDVLEATLAPHSWNVIALQ